MAEYDQPLITYRDRTSGGVCRFIAVCEDSQTELMPGDDGGLSPLVVRIRLQNTSARSGRGRWTHSSGELVEGVVVPGENQEINIAPNRRLPLYLMRLSLAWPA